jgi:sn-1 stearoyl-lipid 9-desaturase
LESTQSEKLPFAWVDTIFIVGVHILALIGIICGILGYIPHFFGLQNILAFLIFYYITGCLGITLGYHRLVTHKSFETKVWVEYILIVCGLLALQSNRINWVGDHRIHHLHSDKKADKHNSKKGFWWSHLGWLFYIHPTSSQEEKIRKTLLKKPLLNTLDSNVLMVLLQLILAATLYLFGGIGMVVWGVLIRIVWVWHITWLINSATHKWGYRWFDTEDNSTNNWLTAILAFGEGWHNTHHAHESSPRHGLAWWEIDVTWYHIWVLQKLGLAWNLKPIPKLPEL